MGTDPDSPGARWELSASCEIEIDWCNESFVTWYLFAIFFENFKSNSDVSIRQTPLHGSQQWRDNDMRHLRASGSTVVVVEDVFENHDVYLCENDRIFADVARWILPEEQRPPQLVVLALRPLLSWPGGSVVISWGGRRLCLLANLAVCKLGCRKSLMSFWGKPPTTRSSSTWRTTLRSMKSTKHLFHWWSGKHWCTYIS